MIVSLFLSVVFFNMCRVALHLQCGLLFWWSVSCFMTSLFSCLVSLIWFSFALASSFCLFVCLFVCVAAAKGRSNFWMFGPRIGRHPHGASSQGGSFPTTCSGTISQFLSLAASHCSLVSHVQKIQEGGTK